ncbi:MAG: hypothetical protein C0514_02635 [Candidatus Puniceispirillum sp.]|nr:hypothetical protein [Candidatus Puniceispirillum sp.]
MRLVLIISLFLSLACNARSVQDEEFGVMPPAPAHLCLIKLPLSLEELPQFVGQLFDQQSDEHEIHLATQLFDQSAPLAESKTFYDTYFAQTQAAMHGKFNLVQQSVYSYPGLDMGFIYIRCTKTQEY